MLAYPYAFNKEPDLAVPITVLVFDFVKPKSFSFYDRS